MVFDQGGASGSVKVPVEVWVDSVTRNPETFQLPPMERYAANNARSPPGVVDLHFQSSATFSIVLDAVLEQELDTAPDNKVWIVTGTAIYKFNL